MTKTYNYVSNNTKALISCHYFRPAVHKWRTFLYEINFPLWKISKLGGRNFLQEKN